MPDRQTNIRIDSSGENVWIEHFVEDKEGNEYEDSEKITVRLTGNVALDALAFYNEFMKTIPKMTVNHLKRDIEFLEEVGYNEILDEGAPEEAQQRNSKNKAKGFE